MSERIESVERWAEYVKKSNGKWKEVHTQFINAQFIKAYDFIKRLSKEKDGVKKIIELYSIKNTGGYKNLLKIKS